MRQILLHLHFMYRQSFITVWTIFNSHKGMYRHATNSYTLVWDGTRSFMLNVLEVMNFCLQCKHHTAIYVNTDNDMWTEPQNSTGSMRTHLLVQWTKTYANTDHFHSKSSFVNAPQCYDTRTLSAFSQLIKKFARFMAPKIHHRVENHPPLFPTLSQVNKFHALQSPSLNINFVIILPPTPRSSKMSPSLVYPSKTCIHFCLPLIHATCPPFSFSLMLPPE